MLLNLISRITLLTLILISNVVETKDILVSTTSGMVRGITINSKNGKAVDSYLGIPYAEPPLKELRFARPVSVKPWSGVFNATKLPSSCPQRLVPIAKFHPHLRKQIPTTSFDEDCLKLNFWVPVGTTPTSKLPVLVYIHGGGFSYGGTTTTTNLGDVLSSEENVIVASMNYRLSSLGFVYLNHSEASGNAGIYDQKLALEWIAANAEFFGGDSKNLVLIGESAGATSVLFHLLAGKVDKLINRVALFSAPIKTKIIMSKEENYAKGIQMAINVGCPVNDRLKMIECLRDIDAFELLSSEPSDNGYSFLNFFPVIDGDIIPDFPENLINSGKLTKKNLLIGTNRDEATIFLILLDPFVFSITSETVKPTYEVLQTQIRQNYGNISDLGANLINYQYTNYIDLDNPDAMLKAIKNLINDYIFTCSAGLISDAYVKTGAKVYKFFQTHYPPSSYAPKWFGAYHGSQNIYVFGDLYSHRPLLDPSEYQYSQKLMKYVANFARTGNPNTAAKDDVKDYPEWPEYTLKEKNYLIWAPNSSSVGSKLREKYCRFWDKLMPEVARQTGFQLP